jgi:hypothetical protein
MKNFDKYIIILMFADYTVTIAQLVFGKLLPLEKYRGRPIYGRWVYDLGFVFSVDEPFHINYNPMYFITIESAKRSIDSEAKHEFVNECIKFIKVMKKIKVAKSEYYR